MRPGPLFLLCLRAKRMGDFVMTLSTALVSWGLVNLPVLLLAPDAWRSFWVFNSERGGDLGSIWYVLSLAGRPGPQLNWVSAGLCALGCVGILGLIFAPWTVLMYVLVFPMNGFDWIWVGLAIGADVVSYIGGYHNRQSVPGYTGP